MCSSGAEPPCYASFGALRALKSSRSTSEEPLFLAVDICSPPSRATLLAGAAGQRWASRALASEARRPAFRHHVGMPWHAQQAIHRHGPGRPQKQAAGRRTAPRAHGRWPCHAPYARGPRLCTCLNATRFRCGYSSVAEHAEYAECCRPELRSFSGSASDLRALQAITALGSSCWRTQ